MEFSCYDCQQVFPINQLSVCKRNKDEKRMEKLLKLLVCEKCAEKHEEICEESIHPKNARRLIVNATSNSIDDFLETFINKIRLSLKQIEGSAERWEKEIRERQANLEDSKDFEMGNELKTLISRRDRALLLINSLKAYNTRILRGNVPTMGSKVKNDENENFEIETENMNEERESELVYNREKLGQLGKQKLFLDNGTMERMTKWELFKPKKEKMKFKTEKGKTSIVEPGTANRGILKKKEVSFGEILRHRAVERNVEPAPLLSQLQTNPWTNETKPISPPRKPPTQPPTTEPALVLRTDPWNQNKQTNQSNSSLLAYHASATAMDLWSRAIKPPSPPTFPSQETLQSLPRHPLKNIKSNAHERTTSPSSTTSTTPSRPLTPLELRQSTQNPLGNHLFDTLFGNPRIRYDPVGALPVPSFPWSSMPLNYNYLRPEYGKEQKRANLGAHFIEITGLHFDGKNLYFDLNNASELPMLIRFIGWEPRGNGVKIVFPGCEQPDERQYYKMCFELAPNNLTRIFVDFSEAKHVLAYYAQQNSPEYYAYVHLSGKGQINKDGYFALAYATVCLKYTDGKWTPESTPNRPVDHFRWKA